jgi:hypothetical protein
MDSQRMFSKFAPFGVRHEIAKRYTPIDWFKSLRVKKLINKENADEFISQLIEKSEPGLVGRMGGTEARFIGEYLKLRKLQRFGVPIWLSSALSSRWKKRKSEVFAQAGFYFGNWKDVDRFCSEYLHALENTDVLGAWGVAFTWPEAIGLNPAKTRVIPVGFTAPWVEPYSGNGPPWCQSLEGRRVLVVSGFATSIESQHKLMASVFKNTNFPRFELSTVRAPIVTGEKDPDGSTWFELLDHMKDEISKKDFDVALIAAGAFSYPLAAHVKKIGKIGIHCGGGLQIFFGVMGNRWNNSPEVLKYVNEYWVRPSADERPKTADQVENACYW